MLAPQFSLRRLMAFMTLCGFVCLAIVGTGRGLAAGFGLLMGVCGLGVMIAVQGLLVALTESIGKLMYGRRLTREAVAETAVSAGTASPLDPL